MPTNTNVFHLRSTWTAILDVLVSVIAFFVGKYVAPNSAQDILFIIGALQVPAGILIGAFTYDDNKKAELRFKYEESAAMMEVTSLRQQIATLTAMPYPKAGMAFPRTHDDQPDLPGIR